MQTRTNITLQQALMSPNKSSMNVTDFVIRAQQSGGRDATLATIQEMIRVAGTTYDEVKKFGQPAPSGFSVPSAILPRSFLKKVLILANEWLDVYGELPAHERDSSRVRVLEPVSTPSD